MASAQENAARVPPRGAIPPGPWLVPTPHSPAMESAAPSTGIVNSSALS